MSVEKAWAEMTDSERESALARAGEVHARWDEERARRVAAEEAADEQPRAEARARAEAEAEGQRRDDAEKGRRRRAEYARIAELNRQTAEQVTR